MGLADHSEVELRKALAAEGVGGTDELSHEELVDLCEEEGVRESDLLVSGTAPDVPVSIGSEAPRRGPIEDADLPDLDPVTARGIEAQNAMPRNPALDYPVREQQQSPGSDDSGDSTTSGW